jgi:hypothetical protein
LLGSKLAIGANIFLLSNSIMKEIGHWPFALLRSKLALCTNNEIKWPFIKIFFYILSNHGLFLIKV